MLEAKDLEMIAETIKQAVEPVRKDVADIRFTVENEVLKGIHIIGKGHLDLSRKMNQVLETKEERELIKLRILSLEHELRRIKEHLDIA